MTDVSDRSAVRLDASVLAPQERVLSTLNRDGSRRWLRPRVSPGRFLARRRLAAFVLIAIFVAIPQLRLRGKPLILLDVVHRQFTFFGYTFLPTDTLLLAILMVALFLGVFLTTALLGRVWCGWICPQTVYMEFVYRPLERMFDGKPGRGSKLSKPLAAGRTVVKYLCFLIISCALAHTFLAYFVGVEALSTWIRRSPLEHPSSFLVMAITTGLMMFDFCYFREQTCTLCCPYGRFQSVMLDRHSLIISYDRPRGEPRGPLKSSGPAGGDCIDCGLCYDTCPTGIDIRDGLQMECVGCAQCIDACDAVMSRIGKSLGLVRYGSQAGMEGQPTRLLRPRVIVYPILMTALAAAFLIIFLGKQTADVTVLRGLGVPFVELPDGGVANVVRLKITNRGREAARYSVEVLDRPEARLVITGGSLQALPGQSIMEGLNIVLPRTAFKDGTCDALFRVSDGAQFTKTVSFRLLGPSNRSDAPAGKEPPNHG